VEKKCFGAKGVGLLAWKDQIRRLGARYDEEERGAKGSNISDQPINEK